MRLAIIGSRDCPPIQIEDYLENMPDVIVSGGARGSDTYAREFALRHNLEFIEIKPDYHRYGSCAPLVRNKKIVEACDSLLAFWNGNSRGTIHTIRYANKLGKPVRVIYV